jgi:4-oxalocrotonate tautomerase
MCETRIASRTAQVSCALDDCRKALPRPIVLSSSLAETPAEKRTNMPYVHIRITPDGATRERKARVIRRVTDVLVEELDKDPETTFIVIEEVPTDDWGIGGETVTVRRQGKVSR